MIPLRRFINFLSSNGGKLVKKVHTLPDLPYDYDALEPVICGEMIHFHHCEHGNYVANLNNTEAQQNKALEDGDANELVNLGPLLAFYGGGHINHTLFWKSFTPEDSKPSPCLLGAINKSFGDIDRMKKELACACGRVAGSGWGWLGFNCKTRKMVVTATENEDPLEPTTGFIPLLGFDVWEHAYYLQYQNNRDRYVDALFDVVNWDEVTRRYENAIGQKKTSCRTAN